MTTTETTAFVPGQARGGEHEEPAEGSGGSDRRTILLIGGGALAVVLLLIAGFLMFAGGKDNAQDVASSPPGPVAQPTTAPTAAPSASTPSTPAKTAVGGRTHAFRDPFKALIAPAGVAGSGAPSTPPTGTSPTTGTTATGTPATADTTTTTSTTPATPTTHLTLISVATSNESARISVDGTAADVAVGQVFAEKFKALRFSEGTCGTFQFGDDRFDLCEGQSVRLG